MQLPRLLRDHGKIQGLGLGLRLPTVTKLNLLQIEFFFNITQSSLASDQKLGLLCKLGFFRAIRITFGDVFVVEHILEILFHVQA